LVLSKDHSISEEADKLINGQANIDEGLATSPYNEMEGINFVELNEILS